MQERTTSVIPPEVASCVDLTARVRDSDAAGAFPFDGEPQFDELFERITRAMHRRTGHHVLLVGERGVGQSALMAELARRAASGRIPFLNDHRLLSVDCRYVAPDESRQRLVAILSCVAGGGAQDADGDEVEGDESENVERPAVDPRKLVVCLDGFAKLLKTDRATTNKDVLLSILSRVPCRLIGLMSPREFEELASDDPEMLEFFARVDVEEPNQEVAKKLLLHFATGLAGRYEVEIEEQAIERAVVLSANYILNERLPAKALRILERVCEDIDYERRQLGHDRNRVTVDDVVRAVAEISGVPEETLRGIAGKSDYVRSIGESIVGQQHAVRDVATEMSLIKAGLTDAGKPASVMLFVGQTGTGKTEMAKVLARFYSTSKRLKTYTLGNFIEAHSVSGIIGVPAGYMGHDAGGRLINDLNADPYGVFLLDEADKTHPDVLQPFLNLFDEGWIRDQRGVKAYADKSIFILTTNVGQRMLADMAKQGKSPEEMASQMKEALSKIRHTKSNRPVFTPEFLARIKRVVVFQHLDREAMEGICRLQIEQMQQTWQEKRQKRLEVAEELVQHIADKAGALNEKSSGKEGGRIVRKLIADLVDTIIQCQIAERPDEYRAAGRVVVGCSDLGNGAADSTGVGDIPTLSADVTIEFLS